MRPRTPVARGAGEAGPGGREPVRSLYLHAPFCSHRCGYCDFPVSIRGRPDPSRWARILGTELAMVRARGTVLSTPLDTIYVGGGTPSHLGPAAMEEVMARVGAHRIAPGLTEFTAEANPEDVTSELAAAWRDAGVTRVSLGLQSFHDPTLAWLERRHRAREGERSIGILRDAGFESLGVDLIYGVPGRLRRPWERDLERVVALELPHVTLWELTAEPGTALGRRRDRGRAVLPGVPDLRRAYLRAMEILDAAGYEAYEASALARPGHASRHTLATLEGRPYLGLGSGAHSFEPPIRRWNLRDWGAYQTAVMRGTLPREAEERLDAGASRLERIWLGLRSRHGLSVEGLPRAAMQRIRSWEAQGAARVVSGAVRMTPAGWHDLDRRVLELDAALDDGTTIPPRADEGGGHHGPSR